MRPCHTRSISDLLELGNDMRIQSPTLKKTSAKNARWFIRPYFDRLEPDGSTRLVKERIYLGSCAEMSKRDAQIEANRIMLMVNNRKLVLQSQINFGDFLDEYEKSFVHKPDNLSVSTRPKYLGIIRKHIRPEFGHLTIAEVTTKRLDDWLTKKAHQGLSWASRADLRNLVHGIFTQAEKWGYWEGKNPAKNVDVGRRRPVREKRKISDEQWRQLLAELPDDVKMICMVQLFCTLRISEVMGLQWRHIDFLRGVIEVRQRYYRGDVDEPKTRKSTRDVPMGCLDEFFERMYPGPGHDYDFVFSVNTHLGQWKKSGICRDARDISRYFLKPAAIKIGIYYPGFGFHSLRREAITSISANAGVAQAMNAAGHSKPDMSQEYSLNDFEPQARAIRAHQERILRPPAASVELEKTGSDSEGVAIFGPNRATFPQGADRGLDAIIQELLELGGGPDRTRICDLYRVKVAL